MQVDLEELLEPERLTANDFSKLLQCRAVSRSLSNNDEDILEGHDNGTATSRKGSQSMISLDKIK